MLFSLHKHAVNQSKIDQTEECEDMRPTWVHHDVDIDTRCDQSPPS